MLVNRTIFRSGAISNLSKIYSTINLPSQTKYCQLANYSIFAKYPTVYNDSLNIGHIDEFSRKYATRSRHHIKHPMPQVDAGNIRLLKRKERRQMPIWDPNLHKIEMEKLGISDSNFYEDEEQKLQRLRKEETERNAVLAEIDYQLVNDKRMELFAVVQITGKQFKVTEGDIIVIQGYWAPDVGDLLRFEKVLLVGGSDFTLVGQPMVDWTKFKVEGTVIEKTLSDLKIHFVLRRRQNYRRIHFDKVPYTMVRINKIEYDSQLE